MAEGSEMIMVEIKPGDVRRVNPRDLDAFMAANPGAKNLSEAKSKSKAVKGPAENK